MQLSQTTCYSDTQKIRRKYVDAINQNQGFIYLYLFIHIYLFIIIHNHRQAVVNRYASALMSFQRKMLPIELFYFQFVLFVRYSKATRNLGFL